MRIFITGSTGLLGSTLLRLAPKNVVLGASYHKVNLVPAIECAYFWLDITRQETIMRALAKFNPDVVIHTAAQASPDYCDKNRKEAYQINVQGTKNIIQACKKYKSSIVFITTNGIYDGNNPPYSEQSKPNPVDYYGKTKLTGENLTKTSGIKYIIMRFNTMYGWNNPYERQNPVTWLIQLVGENKISVNLVKDMYNNFLFVEEAAKAIWKVIKIRRFGEEFNISGADCINRYEFSLKIADTFNLDKEMIKPVAMNFFKNFVIRPKNTCFVTEKMQKQLQMNPLSVETGLKNMKKNPLSYSFWKEIK